MAPKRSHLEHYIAFPDLEAIKNCRFITSKAKIQVASYQSTLKTKQMAYWLEILSCQGVAYPRPSPSRQLSLMKYLMKRVVSFIFAAR